MTEQYKAIGLTERAGALYKPRYVVDEANGLDGFKNELLSLSWLTKRAARHELFMSTTPRTYTYGNRGLGDEEYTSVDFSPYVFATMWALNRDLNTNFNVCFLNKYDDQFQHLGWHADDFPGMDHEQPIAVVSFGAEREIWVKDKRGIPCTVPRCKGGVVSGNGYFGLCDVCDGTGFVKGEVPDNQRILLEEGSLFLMPVGFQDTHLHRIPKHDRPCGWRISLTFRSFK